MTSGKFEIVIPLFNDEENFVNLIENLKSHGISLEHVVVVLSGEKGAVEEKARNEQFRLHVANGKLTPGDARNLGANKVTADYIVFLDSDVLITESWKNALDDIVASEEEGIFGETYHISKQPSWIELAWFEKIRKLDRSYINGGNIVIKRSLFERLEGFDSRLETGEDYDLCMRAASLGFPPRLDPRLVVFHEGNPKTVSQFLRREKWHAKGDLSSLREFFGSKVMMAAGLYGVLLVVGVLATVAINFSLAVAAFLVAFSFSALLTFYKLGLKGGHILNSIAVMNLYLFGRALAILGRARSG